MTDHKHDACRLSGTLAKQYIILILNMLRKKPVGTVIELTTQHNIMYLPHECLTTTYIITYE